MTVGIDQTAVVVLIHPKRALNEAILPVVRRFRNRVLPVVRRGICQIRRENDADASAERPVRPHAALFMQIDVERRRRTRVVPHAARQLQPFVRSDVERRRIVPVFEIVRRRNRERRRRVHVNIRRRLPLRLPFYERVERDVRAVDEVQLDVPAFERSRSRRSRGVLRAVELDFVPHVGIGGSGTGASGGIPCRTVGQIPVALGVPRGVYSSRPDVSRVGERRSGGEKRRDCDIVFHNDMSVID